MKYFTQQAALPFGTCLLFGWFLTWEIFIAKPRPPTTPCDVWRSAGKSEQNDWRNLIVKFQEIDPDTFKPSRRWPSLHLLAEESHYLSLKDKCKKRNKHKSEKDSYNIYIYIFLNFTYNVCICFLWWHEQKQKSLCKTKSLLAVRPGDSKAWDDPGCRRRRFSSAHRFTGVN